MLIPGESIDDFKEVTANEKAAIEASDAMWEAPSEELIANWDEAWFIGQRHYGQYNRESGFFEGNGEIEITTEQAREILLIGKMNIVMGLGKPFIYTRQALPTLLPLIGGTQCSLQDAVERATVRTLRILDYYIIANNQSPETRAMVITNSQGFGLYSRIEEVKGILNVENDGAYLTHFYNGFTYDTLKTLWVYRMKKPIDLRRHSNFRLECVQFMVENAANTSAITITLHPTAYARVTDELFALAAEKNITIAST